MSSIFSWNKWTSERRGLTLLSTLNVAQLCALVPGRIWSSRFESRLLIGYCHRGKSASDPAVAKTAPRGWQSSGTIGVRSCIVRCAFVLRLARLTALLWPPNNPPFPSAASISVPLKWVPIAALMTLCWNAFTLVWLAAAAVALTRALPCRTLQACWPTSQDYLQADWSRRRRRPTLQTGRRLLDRATPWMTHQVGLVSEGLDQKIAPFYCTFGVCIFVKTRIFTQFLISRNKCSSFQLLNVFYVRVNKSQLLQNFLYFRLILQMQYLSVFRMLKWSQIYKV